MKRESKKILQRKSGVREEIDPLEAAKRFLLYVRADTGAMVGTVIVLAFVLTAILAPVIAPYDPVTPTSEYRSPPSWKHLFGTDPSGLDVFSRTIYAARVDLFVGIGGAALSMVIGIPLGVAVGYFRGWGVGLVLRGADLLQAFPVFVLAMAAMAVAGPSIRNVLLIIGILNVPIYVRLVRSEVLVFRERPAIEAARCVGVSDYAILRHYLLPNNIEADRKSVV